MTQMKQHHFLCFEKISGRGSSIDVLPDEKAVFV